MPRVRVLPTEASRPTKPSTAAATASTATATSPASGSTTKPTGPAAKSTWATATRSAEAAATRPAKAARLDRALECARNVRIAEALRLEAGNPLLQIGLAKAGKRIRLPLSTRHRNRVT